MLGMGLGFYMLHNTFQAQVTEVAPKARASAVALHAFSFFCGQALGVVLMGVGHPQHRVRGFHRRSPPSSSPGSALSRPTCSAVFAQPRAR